MPLWGIANSTSIGAKPKYLSAIEKAFAYATSGGWVWRSLNANTEEVLVSVSGLTSTAAAPAITQVHFGSSSVFTQGANGNVTISYDTPVTTTGSPTVVVRGTNVNATATLASGNNTNRLHFNFTVPANTQTISLQGQSITLSGGTIKKLANTSINAGVAFTNTEVVTGYVQNVLFRSSANIA